MARLTPPVMSNLSKEVAVPSTTELPVPATTDDDAAVGGEGQNAAVQAITPPNGGWVAWLQVSGSFVLYFNTLLVELIH